MSSQLNRVLFPFCLLVVLVMAGCKEQTPTSKTGGQPNVVLLAKTDGQEHAHERDNMLIVDAGKHHALLTAHLSPKGNELDIFIETASDANPAPVAIPMTSFKAFVRRMGEDRPTELTFDPAPADERPAGEMAGTCSHFVAKTPWMKADDILELTVPQLKMDDGVYRVVWKDFQPQKFAHHTD